LGAFFLLITNRMKHWNDHSIAKNGSSAECHTFSVNRGLVNTYKIDEVREGQRLKNNNSRRLIPIHRTLLDLGFIEFINNINHERIFPELKQERDGFGTAASKWFGRFKTKLGFGKGYDFHSFRHTVATQLKNADVSAVIAGELLGHGQNNITYDRYGKSINIRKLEQVINILKYT
ncbi:tyrosine-type recombinase/integrase, partial [Vibrio parahaemolyticus]